MIDLAGQRFGRLQVIRQAPKRRAGRVTWQCMCDCGAQASVQTKHLRNGESRSCGCLRREVEKVAAVKHGKHRTPEYTSWRAMRDRCLNPKSTSYPYYGGRGVTICAEWRESFTAFLRDMGPRPFSGATIDRIDPDGDYELSNCRWATRAQQTSNRRQPAGIAR